MFSLCIYLVPMTISTHSKISDKEMQEVFRDCLDVQRKLRKRLRECRREEERKQRQVGHVDTLTLGWGEGSYR